MIFFKPTIFTRYELKKLTFISYHKTIISQTDNLNIRPKKQNKMLKALCFHVKLNFGGGCMQKFNVALQGENELKEYDNIIN